MEAVKELAYPTVLIRGAPHGSSSDQLRLALKPLNFSPTQISKQTKNGSFMINLPQAEALALVKTDKGSLPHIQNFILTPLLSNLNLKKSPPSPPPNRPKTPSPKSSHKPNPPPSAPPPNNPTHFPPLSPSPPSSPTLPSFHSPPSSPSPSSPKPPMSPEIPSRTSLFSSKNPYDSLMLVDAPLPPSTSSDTPPRRPPRPSVQR